MALVVVVAVYDFVRAREQWQVIICCTRLTTFCSLQINPTWFVDAEKRVTTTIQS